MENEKLFTDLKRLVEYYARRLYDDSGELWEFLFDLVMRGAAKNKRYAAVCLRHEFYRLKKIEFAYRKRITEFDETTTPDLHDYELAIALRQVLELLKENERDIIIMRYYLGFSAAEIAVLRGVSRQAIHRTLKKTLDKLKTMF